ncbi:MAG: PAS domain-containing sensor histidine kinase [Nitrosopumilus sp.]
MHREVSESDDPMNATKRTVFFKKAKPSQSQITSELESESKVEKEIKPKSTDSNSQILVTEVNDEIINDEVLEESEKLVSLQKEIENAKESHKKTKEKLELKSKSLKKARSTLSQTKKQLDSVMASELSSFENKKLEVIGEMSSKMAHDMRNPLTVLQSQIDLMKLKHQAKEDQVLSESLLSMESAITHITNQINDVLGFIRKPELRLTFCDLKELVKNSINEVKFPKDVELVLSLESCLTKCDVIKIRGIVTNILQNAVQAVGVKGEIKLQIEDGEKSVSIKIMDSGPGIPEEQLEQIFEPMFTTKSEGTGLGLASCKQLLEMHDGTITVQNNPTTFTITIPKKDSSNTVYSE